jgi:uncharacterized protein VirK/YbjX
MTNIEEKVKFIVAWYNKEKIKFTFTKQVALANIWIEICTKNEEYEMASAINQEKIKVIAGFLNKKRQSRTLLQKIKYYIIKLKRKFK